MTRSRIPQAGPKPWWAGIFLLALLSVAGGWWMYSRQAQPAANLEQAAEATGVCVAAVATLLSGAVESVRTYQCARGRSPSEPVVFQAASLGKPVFAYGVLKLVGEGRLDLDAPLARYLPKGYMHAQQPFDPGQSTAADLLPASSLRDVTARQILTHTSGLPNWAEGNLTFESPPGTAWRYSGEGYVLLQSAVEAVSGMSLNAFMQAEVFDPLAMHDSSYEWVGRYHGRFASGLDSDGRQIEAPQFYSALSAATLYTTAEDYARFLEAVLADREAISVIRASAVDVAPGLGFTWGLGWGLWKGDGGEFIWHWGDNPGFKAFVIGSLRTGDGVVVLTNSDNGLSLAETVVGSVLPEATGVFRFYMLRNGVHRLVCRELGWCF